MFWRDATTSGRHFRRVDVPHRDGNPLAPVVELCRPARCGARAEFVAKGQPVMSIPFFRLLAPPVFVILCGMPGSARAGDLEDCNGPVPAKVESGCTAIIGDQSRPPEDRLRA